MDNATVQTLKSLERKFWQSLVDNDADTALAMLSEPSLMVSPQGSMKFDHAAYRRMAETGPVVLNSFELGDIDVVMPTDSIAVLTYDVRQVMAPRGKSAGTPQRMRDTSTWVRMGNNWKCVMHTETPVENSSTQHH